MARYYKGYNIEPPYRREINLGPLIFFALAVLGLVWLLAK